MSSANTVFGRLQKTEAEAGKPYGPETIEVVESVVRKLMEGTTTNENPGMLLGKIQSGKTRTYLGVIAHAIDEGYKLFIVLTKGTKALTIQTMKRLEATFMPEVEDEDTIRVFDIMSLPTRLTIHERRIPLILVVKKETRNLERLVGKKGSQKSSFFDDYPEIAAGRALIIDDEADYASIGFRQSKDEAAEMQKIMSQIAELRARLPLCAFLQVTATPYSLYLQPSSLPPPQTSEFRPVRPAFTELVPIHSTYIGGDFYFDQALVPGSVASFLYEPVDANELDLLKKQDRRRFKESEALTSNGVAKLRIALVNFVVGGIIRRLQARSAGVTQGKYSFIIHTERGKSAHEWQDYIIESIKEKLREEAAEPSLLIENLIRAAYDDLSKSIVAANGMLPPIGDVLVEVEKVLESLQVVKVNSEQDVMSLLDDNGQLKLSNKLNIFIGGQILDRGLTIPNLIGFYYGRRALRFQQDTVLQHARMYGARPATDLAVTRFYTSPAIYETLRNIHDFDEALRKAFLNGGNEGGVVFIRQEGGSIIPCSPNKILVSSVMSLQSGKRLLPVGFQTQYKTHIGKTVSHIDQIVKGYLRPEDPSQPVVIPLEIACQITDLIASTFDLDVQDELPWNLAAFKASMSYVSRTCSDPNLRGHVYLLARYGRKNSRIRESGRPTNAPDTDHIEGEIARKIAHVIPMLMLFKQEGTKDLGWRDCPFWWPVLHMPTTMGTVVFASDIVDSPVSIADDDEIDSEEVVLA